MKRLLYSSIVVCLLSAFSCSGNGKASKSSNERSESSAVRSDVHTTSTIVTKDSATKMENKTELQKEEVHDHGVPNQSKLDSVKNSYPKKR